MTYLHTVTITGADDAVDYARLFDLSAEFPFVEWAILRSSSRAGAPRYPSEPWIDTVEGLSFENRNTRFAGHLCGELSRSVMAGFDHTIRTERGLFRRFQLNGWSSFRLPGLRVAKMFPETEFIAQATHVGAFEDAEILAGKLPNLKVLYDPSGGCGLAIDMLSAPSASGAGYAGGIGPSNVIEIVSELAARELPFWIDMESGVRTDDKLDLGKVRQVLAACAPFVAVSR